MKYFKSKISITLFASILLLSSCGPYLQFFNVEVKVPANLPVDFKDKSVSVFTAIPLTEQLNENTLSTAEDSVLMINFAKGMATSLEKHLALDAGAIPVFNHFESEISDIRERSFIESLSQSSESDVLILLENLKVGKFEKLKTDKTPVRAGFATSYIYAPLSLLINIYEGSTGDLITSLTQNDTIYWEILSKEDVREERLMKGLFPALNKISVPAGEDIINNFFPDWVNEERALYTYDDYSWRRAMSLAMDFKWTDAMSIWMAETTSQDKVKASCAAYNIAIACEMLEKYDLAIEWLDYAKKRYPITGLEELQTYLRNK